MNFHNMVRKEFEAGFCLTGSRFPFLYERWVYPPLRFWERAGPKLVHDLLYRFAYIRCVLVGITVYLTSLNAFGADSADLELFSAGVSSKNEAESGNGVWKIILFLVLISIVLYLRVAIFDKGSSGSQCPDCGKTDALQASGFITLRENQVSNLYEYQCECCTKWVRMYDLNSPTNCPTCNQIGPINFIGPLDSGTWEGYKCRFCRFQAWLKLTLINRDFGPNVVYFEDDWCDWGDF